MNRETLNQERPVLSNEFKGKYATLKEDFEPEGECWDPGYWHLKKGTRVYIKENESSGACLIEYIEASFFIDYKLINIEN